MSELPGGRTGPSGSHPDDQAAGLRRLFGAPAPHWLPVLLCGERSPGDGRWLATLARACAEQGARTLVVDAARAHVAAALGARARYDLLHALNGECLPIEACAAAHRELRVLPAARALQQTARTPGLKRRLEAALHALAGPADCVIAVLPSQQARNMAGLCASEHFSDVIVAVGADASDLHSVPQAMRHALSAAEIDTFRLLFQGMDPSVAGSLYSRLAALAVRETGARTLDGGRVEDESTIEGLVRQVRCRGTPSRQRVVGQESRLALETAS